MLETSHIIRKVLQCEACSLSGGNHRWFKEEKARDKRHPYRIIIILLLLTAIGLPPGGSGYFSLTLSIPTQFKTSRLCHFHYS